MNINLTEKQLQNNEHIFAFLKELQKDEERLKISNAYCYCDFPVYKNLDENVVVAQMIIISENHGILLFYISDIVKSNDFQKEVEIKAEYLDDLYSIILTRLLKNKSLRKDRANLKIPIHSILFFPAVERQASNTEFEKDGCFITNSFNSVTKYLTENECDEFDEQTTAELISTFEGAKGLIRPKERENVRKNSKGESVNVLEKEIAKFDEYQKSVFTSLILGVNRIRGLAGSGKTVVLAIKAAITHLRYPNAKIVYTFYTKSLYQHIKRLITRFYRQFDDKDPNWDNIEILHAWGGRSNPGVYYNACITNEIQPMSYGEAALISKNAFDKACLNFLESTKDTTKLFDYVFIDEGQDFPPSFLKLCIEITRDKKVIWAYDELQTIFQVNAPSTKEIFGVDNDGNAKIEFDDDIILYKCYRNPREILVVAHAIGFGLYNSKRIVQMIESKDYWNDIGYEIVQGDLKAGDHMKILRPEKNSLKSLSGKYQINEIIRSSYYDNYSEELDKTAKFIVTDINDGLLPEDILVITVDDLNASKYLNDLQEMLAQNYKISSNNIHADKYVIKDFQKEGCVTLSTVHKAKGNEAYSVYVVGVDALFNFDPTIRERNILFTAMTRSKGWLSVSGIGDSAKLCHQEIEKAKQNFPYLDFIYPSKGDLKIMQRDIKEKALRKSKAKKMLDDLLNELSPEEIERFLKQRQPKKKNKK